MGRTLSRRTALFLPAEPNSGYNRVEVITN